VTNPGDPRQYVGTDKYANPILPVVAIPTTAGTGSEVTQYSVLVDTVENSKRTMSGRTLFPTVAILDPELSTGLPRDVTAHTGLDALSQAMEGFVSKRSTPMGDVLALETCRIVRHWLPQAIERPDDVEARGQMLYAAMLSGCVIAQSGTTLVHGMGYYFTLAYGTPHGLANALLLAPVFQYDARVEPRKVAALAAALDYPCEGDTEDAPGKIGEAVHDMLRKVGVSAAARDARIEEGRLRGFAEHIVTDRPRFKNQIGEPDVDEVFGFFRRAWAGELLR
jgi:alcohol dehydrogenase class IV